MHKSINALFPKTKQAILACLLLNAEDWWYMSDLAKRIGVPPSSLQRELSSLVSAEILVHKKEGNLSYFKANKNCPFFEELQGLLVKTVGIVDVVANCLESLSEDISFAFIFGSIASGQVTSNSDIDLMIIGNASLFKVSKELKKTEEILNRTINPVVYTMKEFIAKKNKHFLKNVLKSKKIFVIGKDSELRKIT